MNPTVIGRGGAIFLPDNTPSGVTAGCVALAPGDLNAVLGWLDPAQHPLIRIGTAAQVGPPGVSATQKPAMVTSVVGPSAGSLSAYAIDAGGALSTTWQNQPGGTWSPRQVIGGPPPGGGLAGSAIAIMAPSGPYGGTLTAYARAHDGGLYTTWQTQVGGLWSGFQGLGGPPPSGGLKDDPAVVLATTTSTYSAYAPAGDGRLYTTWQTRPGGLWAGWQPIGGPAPGGGLRGAPSVLLDGNGTLSAYSEAADGRLYTTWQTHVGGLWSGWQSIGGPAPGGGLRDAPSVIHALTGPLAGTYSAYAHAADGRLYTTWQTHVGGLWAGWQPIGGPAPGGGLQGAPAMILASTGTYVSTFASYARAADGRLYTTWQTRPGGLWAAWTGIAGTPPPGAITGSPTAVEAGAFTLNPGTHSVYALGGDDRLYTTWQTHAGGTWAGWTQIGG